METVRGCTPLVGDPFSGREHESLCIHLAFDRKINKKPLHEIRTEIQIPTHSLLQPLCGAHDVHPRPK